MSRERCLSLDRAQRKQQNENKLRFDGYVPERSPNRIPLASRTTVPQHVPSLPELYRRNYGGGLEDNGEVNQIQCFTIDDDNVGEEYYSQRPLHAEDLPDEFLDDFEAPSFYELPPNASFDEVMCAMATPPPAPQPSAPTAAEKLDAFRAEVAEVIGFDDLRKRMAAHIGSPGQSQQTASVQVDDVRRRMAAQTESVQVDDVRRRMAAHIGSPGQSRQTEPVQIDDVRRRMAAEAESVQVDDVRRRMAAHIGSPGQSQQTDSVQVDDVRRRMAALLGESAPEPQLCPYKIPPLPKDPREIPPPPKDPKDVVAIIRRAQAIARLKALEESKVAKNVPKGATKRSVRGVTAPSKLPPKKQLTNMPKAIKAPAKLPPKKPLTNIPKAMTKPGRATKVPKMAAPRKAGPVTKKVQECPPTPQHPPDYVPEEWAAAILRTRKLAGLKTTNPKLMPKPKTPLAPVSKSPLPQALPHPPPSSTPPTFANIMERVAAIRSRTDTAKPAFVDRKENVCTPTPQDELDEYEALEQIYGATMSDQYPRLQESVTNLQNRINALQLELLQTPPPLDASQRTPTLMTHEEDLDDYEVLEELYGATSQDQCLVTQDTETDLQDRIYTLQQKLLQSPARADVAKQSPIFEVPSILRYQNLLNSREAMAAAAAQAIAMQRAQMDTISEIEGDLSFYEESGPRYETELSPLPNPPQHVFSRPGTPITSPIGTPKRSCSPVERLSGFDDAMLQNIDVPDFDVNDLPDFAFSAEALSDAGFVIGDEVSLGEISMPNFEDDISLDELGLEDISSPDLCDLSTSGTGMALEPDYPLETTTEEEDEIAEHIVEDQTPKRPGLLTTMVNAVVDRFRNIFSPSKSEDGLKEDDEDELNLDSSLPNMFETEPSPKPKTPPPKEPENMQPVIEKALTPKGPIVIPPHPKDPKDYMAIVKRAQAIQKKKAQEAAMAPVPAPTSKEKKGRREVKSTIPKRAPPPKKKIPVQKKKKEEKPEKVYPPGEYSPSYIKAVARARSLAGFKNRSALLNPELKAAQEAEIAAIEALPPVERMRKKMEGMRKRLGTTLPRPSIDALGTLEAIRANLPIPKPSKPKWRPTGRLRADRRVKPRERVFTRDLGRVLIPSKRTHGKKKGWREIDVMSPIVEETKFRDGNFMDFSPLRPHEGQMRLQYLKEQAAKRAAETIRAAEEAQAAMSCQTPSRHRICSPSSSFGTPPKFSPIQLQSPRTEQTRREKVTTKIGANGGPETIREEVTETSTIENGEVHTSTRQVTTKTDEFGNVTCHIQEGKGLSGEDDAFHEDLADIEPPDFLDTSDIPPPCDPSIPTPAEIIERIRTKVQQKLNFSLPAIPGSPTRSPRTLSASPGMIEFPQNLPDEELFDIETPEFERTPERASPKTKTYSPIEKDQRMYAWGEIPQPTPPPRIPTPKVSPKHIEPVKHISPLPKPKSPEGIICVPPHPKDPKDYKAMVKRAQAIQKLKKQQDELAAKIAPPTQPTGQRGRVPISRWVGPPPKDPKKPPRKRMVLKKRVPKVSPKKDVQQPDEDDEEDRECPSEPPPLPQEYRDAVARTRLIHGLKNRTAALNPAVAAKLAAKKAAEEAAQAAFDALPEHEKIKERMKKVRKIPAQKRRIEPSSDILGTIAAIKANMPPIEDVLRQSSPYRSPKVEELPVLTQTTSPRTPITAYSSVNIPEAPLRARPRSTSPSPVVDESLDEFEFMEQYMGAMPEASEVCAPVQQINEDESFEIPDISLLRPYISPGQVQSTLPHHAPSPDHSRISSTAVAPICLPTNLSLDEFENLEAEFNADLSLDEFEALEAELKADDVSLDQFEALEAEAQILYNYDTPKRGERHWGRMLADQFTPSPKRKIEPRTPSLTPEIINLLTPSPARSERLSPAPFVPAPSMRMLGQVGFFQEHGFFDEESILGNESLKRPFITPRADAKPGTIYYDEMQDFKVPVEDIALETSQLMPQTPPKNLQERFQRLKEAHEKRTSPPGYTQQFDVSPATPSADFSPIRLMSPSGAPCIAPVQYQKQISPISSPVQNEWLLNVDGTPERRVPAVKQFRDLEDMPFDELEYEIEPSLTNISYEKPMSPPPRPSDIISRIRSKVQQQLQEREKRTIQKTPEILQMPEDLTDEELFELSAPSFARTPPRTPPTKYKSPRVSLPMAWGEVQPVTPVTPQPRISTPIKQPSPPRHIEIKEKCPSPEGPIVIPPHPKDPTDYAAMVRRAQAIYKVRKQEEAEEAARAPPTEPPKKKGRVPISRWQGPPPKKICAKPKRKLVLKKRVPQPTKPLEKKIPEVPQSLSLEGEEIECPAEPPPLPQEYRDAVARTRLIHGLKNRTAALNPKIAAKIAAKKAAQEAADAAYKALPEHEKIKVRMERLRRKPLRRRGYKPTMEQIAYLEALKQMGDYQYSPLPSTESTTPLRSSVTPRAKAYTYQQAPSPTSQRRSVTPRVVPAKLTDEESGELAEFEALEQLEAAPVCIPSSSIQDDVGLKQRIADLEEQLLEAEDVSQMNDVSLAEFEALEALEAPPDQCPTEHVSALDMNQLISDLQQQQLVTPPRIDPKERYRQLLAQRKTPTTPVMSPVKTPEIRYSPIRFRSSPSKEEDNKRAEKLTTQITRSGNNTIKEQVIETSEIVEGELQHFTNHITTTTDPQGNVTCQINESKRISARDRSGELETSEDLGDIQEPSFLDTTPVTPMERPRPRDIIERIRRQVKESYRPEVPTGHLVELRTPPRMLPLPEEVPEEELLDFSCPAFERTPTRTPVRSPSRSPVRSPDVSIPQLFKATPPPPTPPLPPVSPLKYRIPSPEGPIVIPSHPKDPTDFKTMCRRARKIQQLIEQNEAEIRAAKEAEAEAAAIAAAEAAKPKKKERVPISRWTAPPPKKTGKRKKLVMKKRGDIMEMTTKTPAKPDKLDKSQPLIEEEVVEYPEEPPPLPEHYAQEVALARILAGLKNRTAALNPKVAAREAAKAEEVRKAKEAEAAKQALLNATPPSPIKDYAAALSRMKALKEKGVVRQAQPSIASAAYLDAVKGAMQIRQQQKPITEVNKYESPKTRYDRILAERTMLPTTIAESPIRTPTREDITYSPVRFISPRVGDRQIDLADPMEEYQFNVAALESLNELEELGEFEEPSFVDVSQCPYSEDQYMPLTPPQTPPPAPSAIISRIRQQYEQAAICPESPPLTPRALEFPKELPEEELFELSAPSFAKSPSKSETPIRSPNITIPRYFEETPPPVKSMTPVSKSISPRRSKSPTADMASPPLLGVCPGVRAKTPQGQIVIPPHPKDPTDVAAMITRAQLIQKLQAKEAAEKAAEKAAAAKAAKVRKTMSMKAAAKTGPYKGVAMRRLVLQKKQPETKAKIVAPPSPRECPAEPPELPAEYLAEVAKARILAGLKNKTALLNPPKVTPPPPDYATIMERAAALRAAKTKIQQGPTARELANRQNIINRQQRQERKRVLLELERLRQQQGFDRSIEFEPTTPPPVQERLRAIKSRIPTETPTSSVYPYSPVKTPDILDIPQYQPLVLPPTPPYQYLENVCIPDIEDMSMQFADFNDNDFDIGDVDDLEFQLAEAEAAKSAYSEFDDNNYKDDIEFQLAEAQAANAACSEFDENNYKDELEAAQAKIQNDFDMAERIEMLQQQLVESPNKTSLSHRAVAATQEEYNMADRMEMLQNQFLQTPTTVAGDQEEYNMAERMEMLQEQLLQTPPAHQTSVKDASKGYVCIDDEAEQYDQQDIYDEMMDDFEAMERECI